MARTRSRQTNEGECRIISVNDSRGLIYEATGVQYKIDLTSDQCGEQFTASLKGNSKYSPELVRRRNIDREVLIIPGTKVNDLLLVKALRHLADVIEWPLIPESEPPESEPVLEGPGDNAR